MTPLNLDKYGLIVQQNGDGGDCAANEGSFFAARGAKKELGLGDPMQHIIDKENFKNALDQLEVGVGTFVRHPHQAPHNDPKNFSRDQTTPLVVALAFYTSLRPVLWRLFKAQLSRFLKYQNADFPAPNALGYYFRALDLWYLWPFHLIGDLFFLPSVLEAMGLIPRFKHETWRFVFPTKDDVDDRNLINGLMLAYFRQPTPVSWLARKLYSKFRMKNYGNEYLAESSPVQGAISWYFRYDSGGNPQIGEEYRPIVERIFS